MAMTLEEIERESAKLSEAERAALAARLLGGRDLPVSEEAGGKPALCVCPSCKKPTKRIEIEVESADRARIFFFGIIGALFPDKERGRVCEHCGHIFDRTLVDNPTVDRIITLAFYAIPASVIVGVIWMFVQATIG